MLQDIFYFGALRVILDAETGKILATQDRISGESAFFRFSLAYITRANDAARLAWASTVDA